MNGLGALQSLSDDSGSGGGILDSIASLFGGDSTPYAPATTGPTAYQGPGSPYMQTDSTYYPSGESQSQYDFRLNTTPNPKYAQRNRRDAKAYRDSMNSPWPNSARVSMDGLGLPELAPTGSSYVSPSMTFVNEVVASQTPSYYYPSGESNYQYTQNRKVEKAASGNFSDLINGQLFSGVPNWVLLVGVGAAALMLGSAGKQQARRYAR